MRRQPGRVGEAAWTATRAILGSTRAARLVLLHGVLLGACGLAEPLDEARVAQPTAVAGPPVGPCPDEGCGSNSPVIDVLGFHELSLRGVPNLEGFRIETDPVRPGVARIIKGGVPYDLQVAGGIVSGRRPGFPPLAGPALAGAYIPIHNVLTAGRYRLIIRNARPTDYWLGPRPSGTPFEAYTLEWVSSSGGDVQNLCNNVEGVIARIRQDHDSDAELMGLNVFESVIYEGDRVNTAAKTMSKVADDSWINIGCATHALAKLRMTRNTVHSQDPALPRAWERRQATLKMLAADYCGDGTVFTVAGQKLVWKGDLMTYHKAPWTSEAQWTHLGAACVNLPRMLFPSTALGAATFPDIQNQIAAVCKPARCLHDDPSALLGVFRVSANLPPTPPPLP